MTTFPSLKPSGRTFTPGEYPHTPFNAYNGFQNRVRHSNVMLASRIRLSFNALTESNMLSILNHYQGQFGTYLSFDLSAAVWAGVTTVSDYQLSGYLWRYVEPPSVEDVYAGRYNVELTLETVPPDGAEVDGFWRVVNFAVIGVGAFSADGLSKTVSISFAPTGFEIPGSNIIATSAVTGTGAAASNGAQLSSTVTFATGAAATSSGADLTTTATLLAEGAGTTSLVVTISFVGGDATISTSDYWSDMSVQLYGWESLAYVEWWGN
jgi:hypothetical protein